MAQTINVDSKPALFMPTLYYSQGDVGRTFEIVVSSSDGFTIPSGATCQMVATKPSGLGFTVAGTVSGNKVTFTTTAVMTDEWGRFPAELRITSGNTVIGTANFYMEGERNPHPDGTTDGSQETLIPELTLLVERAENAAQTATDDAIEAASATIDEVLNYLPTEVTNLKSELKTTINETGILTTPDMDDAIDGKYLNKWGGTENNTDWAIVRNISVKTGEKITVYTKSYNTVAVISKDNGDNTYSSLVFASDNVYRQYSYTFTEDMTVVVSYNKVKGALIFITKENVAEIKAKANNAYNALPTVYDSIPGTNYTGKQAQKSGSTVALSNESESYKVFEANVDEFEHLRIDCYAGPNTTYSVGYFFCDENNNIIYQYNNATNGRYQIETTVPPGSKKIYVNAYGFVPYAKDIYKICPPIKYSSLALFEHFGVIGDSFASGELYYSGDYHDKYNISWGQILARKLGTTCTNYSRGGLTTRSWLTAAKGLPLVLSNPAEDIYYCALGINDVYSLGIDYLGSIADITDFESYVDYRDTFYGNYGRIIEQVQNHATNAKIVMFTMASTSGNYAAFNNAIIEIANHYNIPHIIQRDDPFFNTDIYLRMEGSHPTAIGYSGMAEAFERLLNKCINDNLTYFKNAFMY